MSARVLVGRHRVHARVLGRTRTGESALHQALADGLANALDTVPIGDGYWILRELVVSTRVGAGWTSGQMSRSLAHDATGAMAEVQARGVDPDRALWFPDRAAFLARFLQDLAAGRAAGRWEYAGLDRLLARPAYALDEVARAEPVDVAAALAALPLRDLESLARLTADEETVLQRLAPEPSAAKHALVLATLRRLVNGGRRVGPLVLAVVSARDHGVPLTAVREPTVTVAGVAQLIARGGTGDSAALRARDWTTLAGLGDEFLPVVGWPSQEIAELADALDPGRALNVSPPAERSHTPFGGAFVLAPLLDELGDWTSAEDDGWLRLLIVTAALGRGSAPAYDPVLRDLYALPVDAGPFAVLAEPLPARRIAVAPTANDVCLPLGRNWDRRTAAAAPNRTAAPATTPRRHDEPNPPGPGPLPPRNGRLAGHPWVEDTGAGHDLVTGAAAALLAALGRRLLGMAASSPAYLRANVLDFEASVTWGDHEHVVELGHPPLGVLLSITGLSSGQLRVRGHEEVRWTLTDWARPS